MWTRTWYLRWALVTGSAGSSELDTFHFGMHRLFSGRCNTMLERSRPLEHITCQPSSTEPQSGLVYPDLESRL